MSKLSSLIMKTPITEAGDVLTLAPWFVQQQIALFLLVHVVQRACATILVQPETSVT